MWFQPLLYPSASFIFASWPCLLQWLLYSKSGSPCDSKKVAWSSQCHMSSHSDLERKTDHAHGVAKYLVSLRLEKLGSHAYPWTNHCGQGEDTCSLCCSQGWCVVHMSHLDPQWKSRRHEGRESEETTWKHQPAERLLRVTSSRMPCLDGGGVPSARQKKWSNAVTKTPVRAKH